MSETTTKRRRTIWRWEKHEEPDGYEFTHFGRLLVRTQAPPRGEGWEHVRVRLPNEYPFNIEYLAREPY